jgi:hypothetical protein
MMERDNINISSSSSSRVTRLGWEERRIILLLDE